MVAVFQMCSIKDLDQAGIRLEQKEALGMRENIKKEGELSDVRGEERLSHES